MRSLPLAVSLLASLSIAAPATQSISVSAPKLENPLWTLIQ